MMSKINTGDKQAMGLYCTGECIYSNSGSVPTYVSGCECVCVRLCVLLKERKNISWSHQTLYVREAVAVSVRGVGINDEVCGSSLWHVTFPLSFSRSPSRLLIYTHTHFVYVAMLRLREGSTFAFCARKTAFVSVSNVEGDKLNGFFAIGVHGWCIHKNIQLHTIQTYKHTWKYQ